MLLLPTHDATSNTLLLLLRPLAPVLKVCINCTCAADILEMAHAFVGLAPVRFLWAMKQQGLPPGLQQADIPLGDNCIIVPWVDQNVS
jgi:hypothetical protein